MRCVVQSCFSPLYLFLLIWSRPPRVFILTYSLIHSYLLHFFILTQPILGSPVLPPATSVFKSRRQDMFRLKTLALGIRQGSDPS